MSWFSARKFLKPGDAIVAIAWLLLFLLSVLGWPRRGAAGQSATILNQTGETQTISLQTDTTVVIAGRLGESTLLIQGGEIAFMQSPCPGKLCMHWGAVSHQGDMVICIPNGIMISVDGRLPHGLDAVTR